MEDIQVVEGSALGDYIYEIPGGQRNIVTEFHYVPEEPRYNDMKDGEWKQLWHEFISCFGNGPHGLPKAVYKQLLKGKNYAPRKALALEHDTDLPLPLRDKVAESDQDVAEEGG